MEKIEDVLPMEVKKNGHTLFYQLSNADIDVKTGIVTFSAEYIAKLDERGVLSLSLLATGRAKTLQSAIQKSNASLEADGWEFTIGSKKK